MKTIPSLMAAMLLSVKLFSQQVTYGSLIGTSWSNTAQFETIHFIDSARYNVMAGDEKLFTVYYVLDTSTNPTTLIIESNYNGKKTFFKKLIRFENTSLLKIQLLPKSYKRIKWDKKETPENTGVYIRNE